MLKKLNTDTKILKFSQLIDICKGIDCKKNKLNGIQTSFLENL